MARVLGWTGDGEARLEVARVQVDGATLVADGTQVHADYVLHYRLEPGLLTAQLAGEQPRRIELGDGDFFDLAWSPLFNSLPVLRDGLLQPGPARRYRMRWVDVPSLDVTWSEQTYEPRGDLRVGFSAAGFDAELQFDPDGFVLAYPGIGMRI
jgi:hypothetical protein